jgi:hypothetical protein
MTDIAVNASTSDLKRLTIGGRDDICLRNSRQVQSERKGVETIYWGRVRPRENIQRANGSMRM